MNRSFASDERGSSLERRTHAESGASMAPLGRRKPVDESKTTPLFSCFAQRVSAATISAFRWPLAPPAGVITIKSPCALRSMRSSGFRTHSSKSSSSDKRSADPILRLRDAGLLDVAMVVIGAPERGTVYHRRAAPAGHSLDGNRPRTSRSRRSSSSRRRAETSGRSFSVALRVLKTAATPASFSGSR